MATWRADRRACKSEGVHPHSAPGVHVIGLWAFRSARPAATRHSVVVFDSCARTSKLRRTAKNESRPIEKAEGFRSFDWIWSGVLASLPGSHDRKKSRWCDDG